MTLLKNIKRLCVYFGMYFVLYIWLPDRSALVRAQLYRGYESALTPASHRKVSLHGRILEIGTYGMSV